MLPIPFYNFLPKTLQETYPNNQEAIALCNFMDNLISDVFNETLTLSSFVNVDRIPSELLNDLAFLLNIKLLNGDTDTQKRIRIYNAVKTHINRFTWDNDYKLKVYSVTGIIPDLYNFYFKPFSGIGGVGMRSNRGGAYGCLYNDPALSNCFFIDTKVVPGMDTYNALYSLLSGDVPAYFTIKLGYYTAGVYTIVMVIS